VSEKIDRVGNWDKFGKMMHDYIASFTSGKYGSGQTVDLMHFTPPHISIWNILKYAIRVWNGRPKRHDLQKIAHYAEMAWTYSNEDINQCICPSNVREELEMNLRDFSDEFHILRSIEQEEKSIGTPFKKVVVYEDGEGKWHCQGDERMAKLITSAREKMV
jgi:hypothetical protein